MAVIPVLTAASGLDITFKNSADGQLTDPTSVTYDIKEPGGTLVADDASPFKISTGKYDARTTTIPSGFSVSAPWTITWTFTGFGITSSKCEEFSVTDGNAPSLPGLTDIKTHIRLDLDVSTTELTDNQLHIIIQKSIDRLNFKLKLQGTSQEMSINTTTGEISPSPNSLFRGFIVMQAECIIVKRRQAKSVSSSKDGILVRQGGDAVDTRGRVAAHRFVVTDICSALDKCIEQYLSDNAIDDIVSTYGDLVWHGNSRIFEDADFDGDGFQTKDFRSPFDDPLGASC